MLCSTRKCFRKSAAMSATLGLMIFAAPAGAQLTDLQPGRNFASEIHSFGGGFSESVDFGDVDNDGDLDQLESTVAGTKL